jgi:hypothetical protein
MLRIRMIGLALVAVFALSAVAASAALATSTNNPEWGVDIANGGTCTKVSTGQTGAFENSTCTTAKATLNGFEELLASGKSVEIVAKANGSQKLVTSLTTIVCKAFKVAKGAVIVGSAEPAAGTNEEIIEYEECEVEGKPKCEINKMAAGKATITTVLLKSTLVFDSKAEAEKEESSTYTLFEPKSGTKFVEFELSGTCPATGKIGVEGQVAVENVKGSEHLVTHELNAPSTAIKVYWINKAGKTEEVKVKELKLEGIIKLPATYVGKAQVELKSKSDWWIFN